MASSGFGALPGTVTSTQIVVSVSLRFMSNTAAAIGHTVSCDQLKRLTRRFVLRELVPTLRTHEASAGM